MKGLLWPHTLRVQSITVERSGHQEPEAAGHSDSRVRKQEWMLLLAPFLLYIQSRTPDQEMVMLRLKVSLTSVSLL